MFQAFRDRIQSQRRRQLTGRLRKFTEASAISPTTRPSTRPSTPSAERPAASPDVGTLETFEKVNSAGVWTFTYDPYTTERGAL